MATASGSSSTTAAPETSGGFAATASGSFVATVSAVADDYKEYTALIAGLAACVVLLVLLSIFICCFCQKVLDLVVPKWLLYYHIELDS